mgnify:CR=1 FL=1
MLLAFASSDRSTHAAASAAVLPCATCRALSRGMRTASSLPTATRRSRSARTGNRLLAIPVEAGRDDLAGVSAHGGERSEVSGDVEGVGRAHPVSTAERDELGRGQMEAVHRQRGARDAAGVQDADKFGGDGRLAGPWRADDAHDEAVVADDARRDEVGERGDAGQVDRHGPSVGVASGATLGT